LKKLSKKAKKAEGLEKHKQLQREKDQKRKEKKQVSLPENMPQKAKSSFASQVCLFRKSTFSFV
jgi:hypothetical protein